MTEPTMLPITSPDDMVAVLQRRCAQLMAGLQQGAHPRQIKDHIISMYQVADILVEAFEKMQPEATEAQEEPEPNGEEQRH